MMLLQAIEEQSSVMGVNAVEASLCKYTQVRVIHFKEIYPMLCHPSKDTHDKCLKSIQK